MKTLYSKVFKKNWLTFKELQTLLKLASLLSLKPVTMYETISSKNNHVHRSLLLRSEIRLGKWAISHFKSK